MATSSFHYSKLKPTACREFQNPTCPHPVSLLPFKSFFFWAKIGTVIFLFSKSIITVSGNVQMLDLHIWELRQWILHCLSPYHRDKPHIRRLNVLSCQGTWVFRTENVPWLSFSIKSFGVPLFEARKSSKTHEPVLLAPGDLASKGSVWIQLQMIWAWSS